MKPRRPSGGLGRHPRAFSSKDRRTRAIAIALAAVIVGGGALAWIGGVSSGPAIQDIAPDARSNPKGHADFQRGAEIDVRFKQGVVMLHAKQHEHAVTAFHRVLALDPQMPEAHVNMGYALLGLERFEAARGFFESAIALRPRQVNAYYGLAMTLESAEDLPGAVGAMRTYVHLARKDDPHLRKANAALWEWESRLQSSRK